MLRRIGCRMIVHDVMLICPHCHQETGIGTVVLFDHLFRARKKCEKCGREFLIINDDSRGILAQVRREQQKSGPAQDQELHSSRLSVHLLQFHKRHRFRTVRNGACTMCLESKRLLEDERTAWIKFRHDRQSRGSSDAEIVRAHENAFAASRKLRDHLAKCPNCQDESDKTASQENGG